MEIYRTRSPRTQQIPMSTPEVEAVRGAFVGNTKSESTPVGVDYAHIEDRVMTAFDAGYSKLDRGAVRALENGGLYVRIRTTKDSRWGRGYRTVHGIYMLGGMRAPKFGKATFERLWCAGALHRLASWRGPKGNQFSVFGLR